MTKRDVDSDSVMRRVAAALGLAGTLFFPAATPVRAQAAAPSATAAPAAARQRGTVKAIEGSTLTLTSDDGQQIAVAVTPTARILQLPPGSTDLKAAQTISLGDVAVGDRVLVIGALGANAGSFQAGRVILMKSTDIAAQHAREEADWQRRGSGGIVTAVDLATGTINMSSRGKTVAVKTAASTTFRRYAGDSVKFEDAKPGTIQQIRPSDQMRVRGSRSADGGSIDAEEIVSGRFENLAGTLTAVDASAGTVSLQDLATKKPVTVTLTANSAIHSLPPGAAAAFAGGARGGAQPAGQAGAPAASSQTASGAQTASGTPAAEGAGAHRAGSGGDLSQMVARLPQLSVSDLHVGDAVLIVATPASPDNASVTAITLVSGVQPLLSATQGSAPAVTLSPWSLGQNGAEAGGATQ